MSPQAFPNAYSGLAQGIQGGMNIWAMIEQNATRKAQRDMTEIQNSLNVMSNKDLPDSMKVDAHNSMIPIWEKRYGNKDMKPISEWTKQGTSFAKRAANIMGNKDMKAKDKIKAVQQLNLEASEAGKKLDIGGLIGGLEREQRRGILYKPDVPGLPAETATVKTRLAGDVELTRPEIPSMTGGLTEGGRGLTGMQRQEYIETGAAPKEPGSPFGKIAPKDYTPESLVKYNRTGNEADLVPRKKEPGVSAATTTLDRPIPGDLAALTGVKKGTTYRQLQSLKGNIPSAELRHKGQKKKQAQTMVTDQLGELKSLYSSLDKMGAIVNVRKGSFDNIVAAIGATGAGQSIQRKFGTEPQSIRDRINAMRPLLINNIRQASEMGVRGLDSEKELEFYLQAATDPERDITANIAALNVLNKAYGMGKGISIDPKIEKQLQIEYSSLRESTPSGNKFKIISVE